MNSELTSRAVASFLARVRDRLGPMARRRPMQEQYLAVLQADKDFRALIKNKIPPYLVSDTIAPEQSPAWLETARLTIAMSAADKVHAPVFRNF